MGLMASDVLTAIRDIGEKEWQISTDAIQFSDSQQRIKSEYQELLSKYG